MVSVPKTDVLGTYSVFLFFELFFKQLSPECGFTLPDHPDVVNIPKVTTFGHFRLSGRQFFGRVTTLASVLSPPY
jgi:hypothetical protein